MRRGISGQVALKKNSKTKLHSRRWCLVVDVAKLVDAVALTMYGSDEMELVNGLTLYNWGRNHSS